MLDRIPVLQLPGQSPRTTIVPELSSALLHAYRNATYRVTTAAGNIDLKIGVHNPRLAALLEQRGARSAAFVTACNPHSQRRPRAWNARASRALRHAASALGLDTLTGVGFDEQETWPGEESLLVLNIDRTQALTLGRRFQQYAVVWIGPDARPRLLLCGEETDV